jgi:glycosyltransferase involved in cell wall biosynthesis
MKIAIMMRAMDQDSGFRVITERFIGSMLEIDRENSYLLLYRTSKWFGRFASYSNVKEVLLSAPHKLAWDQIAVPYRAWKEGADVIFNPKFTVPLLSHCPVAMGLQEPAWYAWPQHYERFDVAYMRAMLPLYCRKAAHFFPLSNFILEENRKYLRLPFDNSTVVYNSHDKKYFRPIQDAEVLRKYRDKYQLPDRFILAVTRVDHPGLENSKSWHGGKNVETTLRAFALCRKHIPHRLVVVGRRVKEYLQETGWQPEQLEGVDLLGFVPYEELANIHNLSELFVIPSFYEGCSLALLEAMACGSPVIASQTGACPDMGGDAPLFADPYKPEDFAEKMMSVLTNDSLRQELKRKSLHRAEFFSWEKNARLTLKGLARVARNSRSKTMDGG